MCEGQLFKIASPRREKREEQKKKKGKRSCEEVMVVLKRLSGDPGGSDIMVRVRQSKVKFAGWKVRLYPGQACTGKREESLWSLMSSGVSFGLVCQLVGSWASWRVGLSGQVKKVKPWRQWVRMNGGVDARAASCP